jgi:hypothetical protein
VPSNNTIFPDTVPPDKAEGANAVAQINRVALFAGTLFWSWLWGIPGMLLAIPLMVVIKAVCDGVDDLQPIGADAGRMRACGRSSCAAIRASSSRDEKGLDEGVVCARFEAFDTRLVAGASREHDDRDR